MSERHAYPPAPWQLRGTTISYLTLIRNRTAAADTPAELKTVSLLPGKTVGGVVVARYGAGSTIQYHELIAVSAIVRHGMQLGIWVERIYVDDERSLAGGREIWGLPKELAEFDWREEGRHIEVAVRRGGRLICVVSADRPRLRLPIPILLPAFGRKSGRALRFGALGSTLVGLGRVTWEIPAESPLADLEFAGRRASLVHERLRLVVRPPTPEGSPSGETR